MNGNECPEDHHKDPDTGECVPNGPGDDKVRELLDQFGQLLVELEERIGDSPRGRGILSRLRRGFQELSGSPSLGPALQKAVSSLQETNEKLRTFDKLTNSIRSLTPSSTSEDFAKAKGYALRVGAADLYDKVESYEVVTKMLRLRQEYESGRKGNGGSSSDRDSLQELVRRLRQLRGG